MSPDVGAWVRTHIGRGDVPRSIPLRLGDAAEAVLDDADDLLAEHHDAGSDARTHWRLARELSRRALLGGAPTRTETAGP